MVEKIFRVQEVFDNNVLSPNIRDVTHIWIGFLSKFCTFSWNVHVGLGPFELDPYLWLFKQLSEDAFVCRTVCDCLKNLSVSDDTTVQSKSTSLAVTFAVSRGGVTAYPLGISRLFCNFPNSPDRLGDSQKKEVFLLQYSLILVFRDGTLWWSLVGTGGLSTPYKDSAVSNKSCVNSSSSKHLITVTLFFMPSNNHSSEHSQAFISSQIWGIFQGGVS